MRAHLALWARRLLQQGDPGLELATVGQRAGGHDPTLGDELGRRRHLAQLGPQLLDPAPVLHGAMAVGEHRMFVDLTGERRISVELDRRRLVALEAVQRETVQLADGRRPGSLLGHRRDQSARLGVPVTFERATRSIDVLDELRRAARTYGLDQLADDIRWKLGTPGVGLARAVASPAPGRERGTRRPSAARGSCRRVRAHHGAGRRRGSGGGRARHMTNRPLVMPLVR